MVVLCLCMALAHGAGALDSVSARSEYGTLAEGEWRFAEIAGPSRSDLGQRSSVRVVSGTLEPRGRDVTGLHDGLVPFVGGIQQAGVSFSALSEVGGRIVMDLGGPTEVARVSTFSFHRYEPDGGARGPQVYTLYGSLDPAAGDAEPAGDPRWTRIADVDSRPNATGDDWGGRINGVEVAREGGLGTWRLLLWDIRPTLSPRAWLPRYSHTMYAEFDVHTAETARGSLPARRWVPFPHVRDVTIAFKTHFDLGYTGLASEVIGDYRCGMIDRALATRGETADLPEGMRFMWTLPGWVAREMLAGAGDPERNRRVHDALVDGGLAVHALPFTIHTETLDPEGVVRSLEPASRLSRALSLPLPRDAKMTDVPSHSWILPTVLAGAGVEFLHLGRNPSCRGPELPRLFEWEGPDGSRVLTYYSLDYADGLLPPEGWPWRSWLALIHSHDNLGPPPAFEVRQWVAEAPELFPGARIHVGRMSDFADAILRENPKLPVVRGDMPDTWIHGPMSDPQTVALARNARVRLADGALLRTEARALGLPLGSAESAERQARDRSLLVAEHTWGGSMAWLDFRLTYGEDWRREYAEGRFARHEASWDEHAAYARELDADSRALMAETLTSLAEGVALPGGGVLVANPLPWERGGEVRLPWEGPAPTALRAPDGSTIAASCEAGELRFEARKVPAGGYATYAPCDEAPEALDSLHASATSIESPWFRAELDATRGGVRSLIDKRTGRELVDAASPYVLGTILHQRLSRDDVDAYVAAYTVGGGAGAMDFGKPGLPSAVEAPRSEATARDWRVTTRLGVDRVEAVLEAPEGHGLPYAARLRVVLPAARPEVRLEAEILGKPAEPLPEAGWLVLPLAVREPGFLLGRLGGLVDPARDIVPGSNFDALWLDSGMAVREPSGEGVGLCPLDHPLVSLGEPGLWHYGTTWRARKPWVFVNLYNNQWSTDFRLWNSGTWSSRVVLWSTRERDPARAVVAPALEARSPLLAAVTPGGGTLPSSMRGLELERGGVQVTAFGPNPDGPGVLLRLWECAGREGECTVRLPVGIPVDSATPVDLRGRPIGADVPVRDGRLRVRLRAYAPLSLVLPWEEGSRQ